MSDAMVACTGGHLDGQWFMAEEWDVRVLAHQRMQAHGSTSLGALMYAPTGGSITDRQDTSRYAREYAYNERTQ